MQCYLFACEVGRVKSILLLLTLESLESDYQRLLGFTSPGLSFQILDEGGMMRDTEHARGKEGDGEESRSPETHKNRDCPVWDNSGWLDTVALFKYMSGYCHYRGLGLLLKGHLKD